MGFVPRQRANLRESATILKNFWKLTASPVLEVVTPLDPRTCCRLTPSTPTPQIASTTSPVITTRSQTSLVVPRATCSMQRLKCASSLRKCRNARAGTAARKTASVATTATPIVRVELLLLELELELGLTNNHLPHISLFISLPFPLVLHLLFLTSSHFPFKTQSYAPLY